MRLPAVPRPPARSRWRGRRRRAIARTGTRMHDPIVYTMLAETEAATGHPDRAAAAAAAGLDALARTGSRLWRGRLERAADAAPFATS